MLYYIGSGLIVLASCVLTYSCLVASARAERALEAYREERDV